MNTRQLWAIGQEKFGTNFMGVYPVNILPPLSSFQYRKSLICNTQPSTLPGRHWIALWVGNNSIQVFDPLGASNYPHPLIDYLHKSLRWRIEYNHYRIQDPRSSDCGQLCLKWLEGEFYF